ncbi:MAG TPA: hypothetical protein EYH34_12730 [Planctomycetes bacterium]|nr:hypothetical protein [Planctomycetota bacterium]
MLRSRYPSEAHASCPLSGSGGEPPSLQGPPEQFLAELQSTETRPDCHSHTCSGIMVRVCWPLASWAPSRIGADGMGRFLSVGVPPGARPFARDERVTSMSEEPRRDALRWSCVFAAAVLVATGGRLSAAKREAEAFAPVRLGHVKPRGWLRDVQARDLTTGYAGHLDELLQDPQTEKYLLRRENNDFVTRANNRGCRCDERGLATPPAPRTWWHAEMIGDWHDGLLRAAYLAGGARAKAKADRFIEAILKSQDGDGYIGIYPAGCRFHFAQPDGELWSQRCVLLPLLAYYELAGREDVLEAVQRAVKLTIAQYGPGKKNYFDTPKQRDCGISHGLMFLDVLEWLYRLTGDEAYRRAALSFYEDYNAARNVLVKDGQLERLLDPSIPFSGHGPDVMGFLRVTLLCYYLSGKEVYLKAWRNAIGKVERHLGVGGSPLSGHGEEIKAEGQKPDMPYEYCSTFYLLHSLIWALQKTGEARFGDMIERTLFNAAQGARFADGKALTYYSADERLWVRQRPPEGRGNHRFIYTAAFYPSCCHDSGARVYPYTISAMWMRSRGRDGDGLVAALYGPSHVRTEINGTRVSVVEETDYPFSFEIGLSMQVERPIAFPLRLRVPAWSPEPSVTAPGAAVTRDRRGFLVVTKRWQSCDRVRLTLKPTIRGERSVDGRTAVAYGPLVFSLPIPEKAEVVQRFPPVGPDRVGGFCAYQYDPADLASARRPLKLMGGKPGFGFRVVEDDTTDPRYPWDRPRLGLRGTMLGAGGQLERVTLLPMGSTLLRRTFFAASEN